jgi:hypothetical protein
VYGIFLFETLQICLATADIYYWLASGFGDVPRLDNLYISSFDTPIMCGVVSFIVQTWFCYRIWVLKRKFAWWSGLIFLISATQASGAIAGGFKGHMQGHFSQAHDVIELIYMWFVGSALADILIAGTMAYLLMQARAKDKSPLDGILIKLVTLVLETNALTAGFAILSLTIFLAAPKTNWFTCPIMIIGKLYSNTLLVSFNNRSFLRAAGKDTLSGSVNVNLSFQPSTTAADSWHVRSHNPDDETMDVAREQRSTFTIKSFGTATRSTDIALKDLEGFSEDRHNLK